jgi:iron(II)-dependent oxidoreductase
MHRAEAGMPPDFESLSAISMSFESAPATAAMTRGMVAVPEGSYVIGRDRGAADQQPSHQVSLPAFRIDRTEVTNAAFAEFLNALELEIKGSFPVGGLDNRNATGKTLNLLREGAERSGLYPLVALDDEQSRIAFRNGRFIPEPGYENHPVAETTWAGARAYCLWRGGRLPTEVEWEAAARGPGDRRFPWGDGAPTNATVFAGKQSGVTAPVGSKPRGASPFGILDMAGSMAEWTSSLKWPYPYSPSDGRESASAPGERVTRGGDYVYDTEADKLTVSHRNGFSNAPHRGHRHIGFRCVSS